MFRQIQKNNKNSVYMIYIDIQKWKLHGTRSNDSFQHIRTTGSMPQRIKFIFSDPNKLTIDNLASYLLYLVMQQKLAKGA